MNRDKRLIDLFVAELAEWTGSLHDIVSWPDVETRDRKAVDAIARDGQGRQIVIEHTLLQPFTGEKADAIPFLKVAGSLDQRPDLAESGWMIDLVLKVGAIPRGVDWSSANQRLEDWYVSTRASFPVGRSQHQVSDLPYGLTVTVDKCPLPNSSGRLFVARAMPEEGVEFTVRDALAAKLPKLVAAPADRRILLLELDSPARGYWEVGQAIEDLRGVFAELSAVWSIWIARTVAWETENWVHFRLIWPFDLAEQHQESWKVRSNKRLQSTRAVHSGGGAAEAGRWRRTKHGRRS